MTLWKNRDLCLYEDDMFVDVYCPSMYSKCVIGMLVKIISC